MIQSGQATCSTHKIVLEAQGARSGTRFTLTQLVLDDHEVWLSRHRRMGCQYPDEVSVLLLVQECLDAIGPNKPAFDPWAAATSLKAFAATLLPD